jgi:hypothetical protein
LLESTYSLQSSLFLFSKIVYNSCCTIRVAIGTSYNYNTSVYKQSFYAHLYNIYNNMSFTQLFTYFNPAFRFSIIARFLISNLFN